MYLLLTHNYAMEPRVAKVTHNNEKWLNEIERRRFIGFLPIRAERAELTLDDLCDLMADDIRAKVGEWRAKREQEAA